MYTTINKCLLCNEDLTEVLSLGNTPLANEFLDCIDNQDMFPLNLMRCQVCNHVQLDTLVDQDRLYKNYVYVSGTNTTNVAHFQEYAKEIINKFFIPGVKNDFIIDIGSNDGTFLKNFVNKVQCLGVDPAENLAKTTLSHGIETIPQFFNLETAIQIKKSFGRRAQVITCNNMFAHNRDLTTIVKGVKELLSDNGTFIIENSYLMDMINNNIFDVIYHEHMHHHHLTALVKFFDILDMKIYDAKKLPNHGGSIRVYICHKDSNLPVYDNVVKILEEEKTLLNKLKKFKTNIENLQVQINSLLKSIKKEGKTIGIFGYPAKATTFVYGLHIDTALIDFVVDSAALKQGKYIPGGKYIVHSPNFIYEKKPDYIIILGWNFAESIISNHRDYNGKWIIPLPQVKVI